MDVPITSPEGYQAYWNGWLRRAGVAAGVWGLLVWLVLVGILVAVLRAPRPAAGPCVPVAGVSLAGAGLDPSSLSSVQIFGQGLAW